MLVSIFSSVPQGPVQSFGLDERGARWRCPDATTAENLKNFVLGQVHMYGADPKTYRPRIEQSGDDVLLIIDTDDDPLEGRFA
jgi:hypothetical protein